jgi:thiaminase
VLFRNKISSNLKSSVVAEVETHQRLREVQVEEQELEETNETDFSRSCTAFVIRRNDTK